MSAQPRWRLFPGLLTLALLVAACGGGSITSQTPTLTPIPPPSPTPAGFLPTPPGGPMAEASADISPVPCPPVPIQICRVSDRANLCQALPMERAIALKVTQDSVERWALDSSTVQQILRQLDRQVALVNYDHARMRRPSPLELTIVWRSGEGLPWGDLSADAIDFTIDATGSFMGRAGSGLQWRIPADFVDLLLAARSDTVPTPQPPTPLTVPKGDVFFSHPDGTLRWDGPDDSVSTQDEGHCGPSGDLKLVFGIPAVIVVDDGMLFWFARAALRQDDWRWTGYYYGEWQIWQGDDPRTAYLVHTREEDFVFKYRAYGCI